MSLLLSLQMLATGMLSGLTVWFIGRKRTWVSEKQVNCPGNSPVDQWRHLDTQAAPGLLQTPTDLPMEFDYDTCRFLTRALFRQQA